MRVYVQRDGLESFRITDDSVGIYAQYIKHKCKDPKTYVDDRNMRKESELSSQVIDVSNLDYHQTWWIGMTSIVNI